LRGEGPEVGGGFVGGDRGWAAGEDRGEDPALVREVGVADGVYASVEAVELSRSNAARDRGPRQPGSKELVQADHAVLVGGDPGDLGEFLPHTGRKSPGGLDSPP
jgi:hypothetical protein